MTNEIRPDQEELLAAWERQFPMTTHDPEDNYVPRGAWESVDHEREADRMIWQAEQRLAADPDEARYAAEAAAQVGAPLTSNTVSLTRGGQARERYARLRQALSDAFDDPDGGNTAALMQELNDASESLIELERSGEADEQVINLSRGRGRETRTIYGPRVYSPMRPIA